MGVLYIFENCDKNFNFQHQKRKKRTNRETSTTWKCSTFKIVLVRNLSCIGSGFPFGLYTLYHTRARGTDFTEYTWGIDYTLYTCWGIYYWRLVSLGGASAYPPLASDPVEFKTRWEPEISRRERQLIPFPAAIWPMRNGDWGLIDQ